MKLIYNQFFRVFLVTTLLSVASISQAANYYWVGGSGNWSDHNNHWATLSGGAVFHNQVPSPFDNVIFDANSFTAAGQTVTLDVEAFCNNFTVSGVLNQPTFAGTLKNVNVDGDFLIENTPFTYNITGKLLVEGNFTISNMPAAMVFTHNGDVFEVGGDFLISNSQLDYNNNKAMTVHGAFTISGSDMDYDYNSGTLTVDSTFTITNSAMDYRHWGTFNVGQDFLVENSDMYFYHVNGHMNIGSVTYAGDFTFRDCHLLTTNGDHYISNGYTNKIYGDWLFDNVNSPTVRMRTYATTTVYGDYTLRDVEFSQYYQANYGLTVYEDFNLLDDVSDFYHTTTMTLYGSFLINHPDIEYTKTGWIYFYSDDPGETITSTGHDLYRGYFHSQGGSAGEWTFVDDFFTSDQTYHIAGSIISGGNSVNFGYRYYARSWSNAKSIDFTGTDTIYVERGFEMYNNPSTQTLILDNAVLKFEYTGNSNFEFYAGGQTYNDVIFNHLWTTASANTIYIRNNNSTFGDIKATINSGTGIYVVGSGNDLGNVSIDYLNPGNYNMNTTWNRSGGTNTFGDYTITKSGRMSPGLYFDNDNTFGTMTIPEGTRLNMKQNKVQTMDDLVANGTCLERIYINSLSSGTKATLNVASGSVDIDYAILKDIEAIGGAAFNATNTVDVSNNTGWTITPPAGNDFYWIGDAGNWNDPAHWSFSSGGTSANCVPIFTDNVIFDANSFTSANQSVNLDVSAECNDMTWTSDVFGSPNMVGSKAINVYGDLNINGVMDWTQSGIVTVYGDMSIPGTANWSHSNQLRLYGSIALSTGMTWSNPNWTYFYANTSGHTIDMGGHEFNYHVQFYSQNNSNGEWTLASDFKIHPSYYLQHVAGSFISGGFGVDFGYRYYARGWSNVKSLDFTGTDTIYVDRGFEMYNNPSTQSFTIGTAVLKFEYNSNSNFEFYPGGQTYNDVVFNHLWTTTSANNIYIRDANSTFGNIYATINNGTGLYVTGGGNTFGDVNIHYANPGGYSYNTTWNRSTGINTFGDYTITKVGKASVGLYTDNSNTWGTLSVPSLARVHFRYNKIQTMDDLIANGLCDEIVSFQSTSGGTQATISVATDTVKIDNVTLKDMNATGGAIFEASNVNDLGNNTGWTIIPAPSLTFYWINGAGNWNDANHWSLSSGGSVAGCIPQFKDDVVFDDLSFSAASEAATVNVNFEIRNMTWTTDVVGTPNLNGNSQLIINGDVTVDGPMVWSQSGNLYLRGSIGLNPDVTWSHNANTYFYSDKTGNTIDMAGKEFTRHVYFNWKTTNASPEWTLLDDFVINHTSYSLYFYTGTLVSNGNNIVAGQQFDAYYNNPMTLDFTGTDSISMYRQWRLYPNTANHTLIIDTATIYISYNTNGQIYFYGGNQDYYDVVINSTYTWAWPHINFYHNNSYRDVYIYTKGLQYVYFRDMVNNYMRDLYVYNDGSYSTTNVNFKVLFNSNSTGGNTFRDVTIESGNNNSRFQTIVYGNTPNTFRNFRVIQPENPYSVAGTTVYNYVEFKQNNTFTETLELDHQFDLYIPGDFTQSVGIFIPHSDCNNRSRIRSNNPVNEIISQTNGTVNTEWINLQNHTVTGGATYNATDATVTGTINGWNATPEPPHNLYWVGNNGNWNDPDHWALSSGGPGNGCLIPTIRDNVFFDGFSFTGTGYSVNMNTTGLCNNMIWNGASADVPTFTGGGQLSVHGDLVVADDMTWNQSGNLYLYGSMTLNSDMTWNHPNWTRFVSTDTDNTIDMAGHTFDYHVEFKGTGGEWTLEADYGFTSPNSHYTDYNAGSFVSDGYGVDFGYQMDANNSGVKNWNFTGTDTVDVGRIWRVSPTNSSITAGNSLILMEWSGNNPVDFYGGGLEYYDVVFDHNYTGNQNIRIYDNNTWNNVFFYPRNNEKTITINGNQIFNDVLFEIVNDNVSYTTEVYFNGSNTFNNFVLLSPGTSGPFIYFYEDNYFNSFVSGGRGTRFYLGATKTQYVNTDLVLGTGSNPVFLYSTVEGVQANLNKNGGVVCLDFVWLRDQNATGTAEFFAGASSTDLGNNTNWQFGTSCVGYYWVGNSGNWSDAANHWATSSGGTDFHVIPPDQSDNVWFDVNSFTETDAVVTIDVDDPRARDMNWQSAFYTPTLVGTADSISLHGELKLTSAMNMDWEGEWVFKSAEDTTVHAINTSGHTLENVTLAGPGATVNTVGTWQLENNLEVANTLNFERGTLLTNDNTVTTQYFDISTDQYRVLNLAGSEINIVDGEFNVSNVTDLTLTPGTSEIIIQSDGGSSDFIGAGLTYNDLTFATNTSMEGDLLGNNTFNTLKFEPGVTASIEASTTQITNAILANGSCQQEITINSTNPGTQATFSQSTGAVEVEFVNLQDNNATGGATFTANLSNDLGNVTGWSFTSNPVLGLTVTKWDATCPLPSNGSAKAVVTGGVAPITYEWSTLAVTDSIGGLVQGTYWVMAIDSNGCTAIDTFEISQPASFGFMIAADGGAEICYLADNGSASVSVDELALQPVSYQWSNNENTNVISGLTAGSYSVTVTDNANCEAVATATVAQGGDLNPQIEHDEIVCEGSEISFSGTGEGLIFSHGFDGTVIDENIFTTGNLTYTQDDELSITGGGGWGQTFRTNETFERVEGTEFTFKYFYGANTYNMIGWHGNSTGGTYPDLIYAMYFISSGGNGQMNIYEDGGSKGNFTSNISLPTPFVVNEWYEGRIVLKEQGADYYLRKLGDPDWDLFYSSNHSSETDLRVGFSYAYSGLMITDDWKIKSTSTDFTMDWDFGDGGTDTGADVSHAYTSAGTYDVKLVIEKNNGCTDSITSQVVVNELPVLTVSDEVNASCGQCDASATLNASGGAAPYTFIGESFNHSFDGTTINTSLFTKDNSSIYTQNDELSITGSSGWNKYFYTNQTFPREAGNIFSFRYYRGSSDITMVGWYGNSTGSNNYVDLIYGLYFDGAGLYIYEDGSYRGNVTSNVAGGVTLNTWYDIKIVLKDNGADYYVKKESDVEFALVYPSSYSSETDLRLGINHYSGTSKTDDWTVTSPITGTSWPLTNLCPDSTYIFAIVDALGCTGSINYTPISDPDTTDPTITCPENVTVNTDAGQCYATNVDLATPIISDNCPGATAVATLNDIAVNGDTQFLVGSNTVIWTVTDEAGNSETCEQIVTVVDNEAPVLVCPSNQIVTTNAGTCAGNYTIADPISDNCTSATWDYTLSGATTGSASDIANGTGSGALSFNLGVTTVTLNGTDGTNNATSCQFTVTVEDNENPIAACSDITVNLDATLSASVTAADINGNSTDNCDNDLTLAIIAGQTTYNCDDVGSTYDVTLQVTDDAGLTSICIASVAVSDANSECNAAPIANCMDITVSADGNCEGNASAEDFDNDTTPSSDPDGDQITFTVDPVGPYALGITPVTITVSDGSLTATCTATITVEDNTDPVITCPDDVTVSTDVGSCEATGVSLGTATVTDNCSTITPTNDAPAAYVLGANTVTWTADDGNGNVVTCTQTVTVEDNENPTITCPVDVTVLCLTDVPTVDINGVGSSDNCSVTVTHQGDASDGGFQPEIITRTYRATDPSGNSVECDQLITIQDPDPIFTVTNVEACEGDNGTSEMIFTIELTNDVCESLVVDIETMDGTATDGLDYSGIGINAGITFGGFTTGRAACTGLLNGSCMNNFRNLINANLPGAVITESSTLTAAYLSTLDVLVISAWNANVILSAAEQAALGDFVSNGGNLFSFQENDGWNGNAEIANESFIDPFLMDIVGTINGGQNVSITNPSHPIANGPFGIVTDFSTSYPGWYNNLGPYAQCVGEIDNNGQCALAVIDPDVINAGSGAAVFISDGNGATAAGPAGTLMLNAFNILLDNQIEFSGTAGETATVTVEITGETDVELDEIFSLNVSLNGSTIATGTGTILNDDCMINGPAIVDATTNDFTYSGPTGMTSYTWSITSGTANLDATSGQSITLDSNCEDFTLQLDIVDPNGCTYSCSLEVTVEDNVDPVITCPDDVTVSTDAGTCEATGVSVGSATATDNCATITPTNDAPASYALGTNTVTWTADDGNGNVVTCTQTVTVEDNEAPTAICQDITVQLDALGNASIIADDIDNGSFDACEIQSITLDDYDFDCSDVGGGQANNYALDFDGSNDWVKVSDKVSAASLGLPTSEITLESWVNPKSYSIWRSMVSFFQDNGSFERGWDLETRSGGRFAFALNSVGGGGGLTYMESTNSFSTNEWHHVAGVYDGTTMKIYIDGQLENTSTAENGDIWYSDAWLALGMYKDDNENFSIPGTLDEIRIWNIARSQAEIQATMNTTLNGSEPGLVAYYAFEDGPGSTIVSDLSGNGLTGTLNNMDPVTDWIAGSTASGSGGGALVTMTVTDNNGNTSTCAASVTVQDNILPTIDLEASNQTIECDGAGNTAALNAWLASNGGASASDACGVEWTNDFTALSDECGVTGSATVTFTATDPSSNSASTTAIFTIEDTTNPTIAEVAEDETVECDGDGNTAELDAWLAANGGAVASDVCSGVTWSNDFVALSDDCGATGSATVTFTATDECNNSSSTTATFTIEDTTNPTIAEVAEDETVECDGDGNTAELDAWLAANGGAVASDVCSGVTWSNDFVALSDECGATGSATVTFTATDDCDNSSSTTATFTIEDTTNPTIAEVAEDETVECDGAGNTAELDAWLAANGGAVASDICSGVTWSNDFVALSDDCGATGSATVTFTATDDCNNSSSTTATFTIEDTTNPTIAEVAEDETVECDGAGNTAELDAWLAANGGAVASDICSNVTWSNDFVALSDECGATGSATVTFTATDDCDNSSSTTATFTIEDTTNPTIAEVAEDETVECDGAGNTAELDAWLAANGGAVASDICSNVTWSNDFVALSDDCGATGSATVTFTATDDCNNSSSTTATFTIEDTTNPTIAEVAEDETVECDGAGNTAELDAWLAANGGAVASDICSNVTWSNDFVALSDDCGATGSATVTFTATDDCNNSSSTTATFTIEDTTNPTIAEVAEDETVECDGAGNTAELDAWLAANGGAVASDICSNVTWSNDFVALSDDCGATGSATVTFTATDDCNNSSSTTATFTIEDTTNPSIAEVAEDETVECDGAGNTAELDAWLAANGGAVASDICSNVTWSNDFVALSDDCGATGSATVTFTATDDCNNSSSTTATFTIEDTTNPTIAEVAEDETVECDGAGNTAELDAWLAANGGAVASDICSGVTWSNDFVALSDDCGATGSATVTFTATDDCNNSSSTTATFTIEDTTNPSIAEVAEDETVECDGAGNTAELDAWLAANGGAVASDICSNVTWSNDFVALSDDCGATGSATVTFTATDDCNNSSSTTATFTIEDTTNPSIAEVAEDETVECDGAGNTAELDAWLAANGGAVASDVCSGVTWSNDFVALSDDCGATGSATVTFTATDDCNNSSSTTATFTIEDTTNPTIAEVAEDETVECDGAGNTAELDAWLAANGGAIASDVCSGVSWSNDFTGLSDECGATGSATVTFTATDDCNNSSSTTATFTIEDITNPTIAEVAEDETVECDGDGNTTELDAWLAANGGAYASDICSGVSWSNDFGGLSDECGATGSATVTFTVTDDCGNFSNTVATFTIEDTIPPAMTCPDDIAICADQVLVTGSAVSWIPPVPLDICSSVNLVSTHEPGDTFPVGITTVTYTATDECGLETECSFDIEVYELPEVNITESELPIFCQNNVVILTANVMSNTGGITYDWSIGNTTDTVEVSASGMYEVTVTDANGCERSTSYDVTVDTTGLLSAYTILGIDEVHLHDHNVVVNGGVGVLDDDGKAKIQQNTMITGSTTFVKADDIDVKSGSVVTKQFAGTPNVTLPVFLYNPFTSDNDVTVNSGDTVILTDQVYGKLDIKEGATVIFTQQDLFIEDLKTKDDVTIQFSGCTFMRLEKNLNLDDDILFNPEGYSVNVYVDANVEVKEGAEIKANIYANDHNINVNGKEDNQTYMYGRFIGKKIHGHKYVNWDWSTACDPTCEPGDPPIIYSCDCEDGMVSMSLVYDGPAGATVEAWYYGNTSLGTFYDVQPGDTLLVDATTIGEDKLKSNTSFYVNGGSEIEFHTSCSDDILNDTINELTVVGWVDGYNQTCGEGGTGIIPELPCNCEDGMVSLSLIYDGPAGATVEAWYYGNTSLGTFYDVQPGDTLLVDATTIGEDKLKSNTSFYVDGGSEIEFHTSCSDDILNDTINELTVVGWVDGDAGVCSDGGTGDYPELPIDCACDGGMVTLSLEYNGPAGATVEAWYNNNTSLATFSNVQPGDTIMVDATSIGKNKLKSNTSFYVDGGSEIEFHTSCSEDIYDETIDELTVTGWEDYNNNVCPPENSSKFDNGEDEVLQVLQTEADKELNPSIASNEENISFELDSKMDVYPNPAYNQVNLSILSSDKDIELVFLDRMGRKVWTKTVTKEGESLLISIDLDTFNSGVYIIHAMLDGKLHSKRLIIIE